MEYEENLSAKDRAGYLYNDINVTSRFPYQFTLEENLNTEDSLIDLHIIMNASHGPIFMGRLRFDNNTQAATWTNQLGHVIATAQLEKESSPYFQRNHITVSSKSGEFLGTITSSHLKLFPLYTKTKTSNQNGALTTSYRYNILGARSFWLFPGGNNWLLHSARAIRSVFSSRYILQRTFDVNIYNRHKQIHPGLYLFEILYEHCNDTKLSLLRRFFVPYFRKKFVN
jgi:hypothetical protein